MTVMLTRTQASRTRPRPGPRTQVARLRTARTKDQAFKAKDRTKDQTIKANTRTKD